MALMLMAIAAAEVGVGLALVVMIFRTVPRADVDELHALRG
ncbi:MAG TPA: NADH-quinone oxidoreductase subunit K [bacterium]|nr:NADH-quinone oxidoreductase subunit K [bacterium]